MPTDARALARPLGDKEVLALGLRAILLPDDLALAVGEGNTHAVQAVAEALAAVPQHHAVDRHRLAQVKLPRRRVHVLGGVGDGVGAVAVGGVPIDGALGVAAVVKAALRDLALPRHVLVAHEDLDLRQRERGRLLGDVHRHITSLDRAEAVRGNRRQHGGQSDSGAFHLSSPSLRTHDNTFQAARQPLSCPLRPPQRTTANETGAGPNPAPAIARKRAHHCDSRGSS